MCGIFGIFGDGLDRAARRAQTLQSLAHLTHRGPDAWGVYSGAELALGHVRLSVVDPAEGHQPMIDDCAVVSFNGEIYNHIELRDELEKKGYVFRTRCDTEVILKLYEEEGEKCFERFNGQYSLLLWDKRKRQLIVARDRFGIRPLYALAHKGVMYFSSEMKAFDVLPEFNRDIEPDLLFEHGLLWNSLGSDSIYKDIESVESGTYRVYTPDGLCRVCRYYQIGQAGYSNASSHTLDEATEQFRELLNTSVSLRLRSDVPVGAYLSGGIDSTVISKIIKDQTRHQFKTFSVAFEDAEWDESEYQLMASEQIQSEHHAINLSRSDIADNLLNTIRHAERPIFRTAPVPMHLLSGVVKNNDIKVVLTGEGADEILFGYDTFKELKILSQWRNGSSDEEVLEKIRMLYPHLAHYADSKRIGLMKMYYEGFLQSFDNDFAGLNIRINNNKVLQSFFNKDHSIQFDMEALLERLQPSLPADYSRWSLLQKNSFLEIKTLMQGYLLSSQGDRMALSHSVEGRFPFLDHHLVDFVFALPDEFKLRDFEQKFLLKKAYADAVPDAIISRPKRPYMAPDLVAFFDDKGGLHKTAQEFLCEERVIDYGLFDPKMVSRFLRKFSKGVPENTGYRDNMIFIFLLTSQMSAYWAGRERQQRVELDYDLCRVDVEEH